MDKFDECEKLLIYLNPENDPMLNLHNYNQYVNRLPLQYRTVVSEIFNNFIFTYKSMQMPVQLFRQIYCRENLGAIKAPEPLSPTKSASTATTDATDRGQKTDANTIPLLIKNLNPFSTERYEYKDLMRKQYVEHNYPAFSLRKNSLVRATRNR
jgi:hypothetical protein